MANCCVALGFSTPSPSLPSLFERYPDLFLKSLLGLANRLISEQKMPAVPGGVYSQQGPSCYDKMKMGFILGFCVGMASGGLFGGFSALRSGLRGRELVNTVGKVMLQGGGSFGTFLAIGSGLRC